MDSKAQILAKAIHQYCLAQIKPHLELQAPTLAELSAMASEILKDHTPIQLGDTVYHKEIYNGREECLVIGVKAENVQVLYGHGGPLAIKYSAWVSRDGILTQKNK